MKKVSAARAIVEIMEREGADKAFCVPGESFLSVMDELYGHPRIQLVSGRHEGGVSFMAEAYAKASGKVGVCLASRGPGAANLSIGLHTAYQDSTPVVALSDKSSATFGTGRASKRWIWPIIFAILSNGLLKSPRLIGCRNS